MAIINKNFGSEGGEDYVYFHLNGGCGYEQMGFKIESDIQYWLKAIAETEGSSHRIKITANPNPTFPREGTVIPTYSGSECRSNAIIVNQEGSGTPCYVGRTSAYTFSPSVLPCDTLAGPIVINGHCTISATDETCSTTIVEEKDFEQAAYCNGPNPTEFPVEIYSFPYRENGSEITFYQAAGPCTVGNIVPMIYIIYDGTRSDWANIDGTGGEFIIEYWGEDINTHETTTDGIVLVDLSDAYPESERVSYVKSGEAVIVDGKLHQKYTFTENTTVDLKQAKFGCNYFDTPSRTVVLYQANSGGQIIPEFDFLTFTFTWEDDDGKDLDTATFVNADIPIASGYKLSQCPVGTNCIGSITYETNVEPYLLHSGDNWQSGDESVLVNWKNICAQLPSTTNKIPCELYGNWYEYKGNGACTITIKAYKSDGTSGMHQDGYEFKPDVGTSEVTSFTYTNVVSGYSTANVMDYECYPNKQKDLYTYIANFSYMVESKQCVLTYKFTGGRDLKGHIKVGNEEKLTDCSGTTIINVGNIGPAATDIYIYISNVYEEAITNGASHSYDVDFLNPIIYGCYRQNPTGLYPISYARIVSYEDTSTPSNTQATAHVEVDEMEQGGFTEREIVVYIEYPRADGLCDEYRRMRLYYKITQKKNL